MSHNSRSNVGKKFGSETESFKGPGREGFGWGTRTYIYIYIFYLIAEAHESFVRGRGGGCFCAWKEGGGGRGSRQGSLRISFLKSRGRRRSHLAAGGPPPSNRTCYVN